MRVSGTKLSAISSGGGLGNQLWDLAGNRPSLDIPFSETKSLVDTTTGQNLINFTRASSGTYVDSQGVIRTATTNLLLRSEEFDSASWGNQGTAPTVTANAAIAPNGTNTADRITFAAADSRRTQSNLPIVSGASYTISIYALAVGASNNKFRFNFFDQSVSFTSADVIVSSSTWQRYSYTFTSTQTNNSGFLTFRNASDNAANDIYFWGAQLEQSSTVGEYIPTTSTINSAPRFDHNPTTGESLGLLVEESRTNLLLNSDDFSSWVLISANRTLNAATAPDGTLTADRVESTGAGIYLAGISVSNSTTYTYSVFLKNVSGTGVVSNVGFERFGASALAGRASFDLLAGTIVSQGAAVTSASIISFGNGWYRVSVSATSTATTTTITNYANTSGNQFLIWGAQLEAGSFPTSYIPTTTAAVTRSADVASITGSNFSSWYRQDQHTAFVDFSNEATAGSDRRLLQFAEAGGFGVNGETLFVSNAVQKAASLNSFVASANIGRVDSSLNLTVRSRRRAAFSFAASSRVLSVDGETPVVSTNAFTPPSNIVSAVFGNDGLGGGFINGHIRRLTYWPQRLPNETLQQITQ